MSDTEGRQLPMYRLTVVYDEPTRPKTVNGTWGLEKKGLWMKAPSSGKGRVTPELETKADRIAARDPLRPGWTTVDPSPGRRTPPAPR